MNRREFTKAIGLAPAAMLTAKAVAAEETMQVVEFHCKGEVRQTAMTCCEKKHGYDYVVYDNETGEKISEGFVPYPEYIAPVKVITKYQARIMFPKMPELPC